MPQPRLTDEECLAAVKLHALHGTAKAVAEATGVKQAAVEHRLKVAAQRGFRGTRPVLAGYEIKSVSTQLGPSGELQREWIKQGQEAGAPFEVPAGHTIKGVSALLDAEGRALQTWVKTKSEADTASLVDHIKSAFDAYHGRAEITDPPPHGDNDLLSVYVLTDVHHGLLSWGEETGDDYDISIGSARLRKCMTDLVAQAPASSEALILNLGDYFHSNDSTNATPASKHVLDIDSRFYKVVTTGVRLFMDCIDLALQKHQRVRVRCLPGNHDPEASITLTVALAAFYHADPRVTVEQDPSEFFFHLFGKNLIGACHGHRMKPDRMAMSMAMMRPKEWGESKFRWFLFGHIHHETVKEVGDIRCESFQTIASKDAYSAGHGYHSGRSLNSVTLHRERGEIGRHRVNVLV